MICDNKENHHAKTEPYIYGKLFVVTIFIRKLKAIVDPVIQLNDFLLTLRTSFFV
jgi:hypothetical protein